MKRLIGILASLIILTNGITAFAAESDEPLATLDFNIVGIGLEAGPEYQAVPKGIQTLVDTTIDAQGFDVDLIASQLPKDYRVKAELTGPARPPGTTLGGWRKGPRGTSPGPWTYCTPALTGLSGGEREE